MKKGLILTAIWAVALSANAQIETVTRAKAKSAKAALPVNAVNSFASMKTSKDSASYALGFRIAQSLKGQGLQDVNFDIFKKGMAAGVIAKAYIPDSIIDVCIKNYQDKMMQEKIAINRATGKAFLEENAKKPGVVKMTNGMQYLVLTEGKGTEHPTLKSKVKCHYHGTLISGEIFDSSVDRGEPITFPLNGVIKGWQDAVQLMTVGAKWRLFIPSELARTRFYPDF